MEFTKIQVENKLIESIDRYFKTYEWINRGFGDGSTNNQKIGLLGEVVIYKLLMGMYPNLRNRKSGFDAGFDIEYKNKLIDVKTMERKCYITPTFVNNFYATQENYKADTIIFCSYHSVDNVLELCGWIPKTELIIKGKYFEKGNQRMRSDGSFLTLKEDNYEIENKYLYDINTLINN